MFSSDGRDPDGGDRYYSERRPSEERKKQGRTLWEKWTGRNDDDEDTPTEATVLNPLGANIGDRLSFQYTLLEEELRNTSPFEEILGLLKDIRVYHKELSGEEVVRYRLRDLAGEGGDLWLEAMPSPDDPSQFEYALFELMDEFVYDQEFEELLGYETLFLADDKGSANQDGETGDLYLRAIEADDERVEGMMAQVLVVSSSEQPPEEMEVAYWDYEREVMDDSWIFALIEIVQSGDDRGLTSVWRGVSIPKSHIQLMPAT